MIVPLLLLFFVLSVDCFGNLPIDVYNDMRSKSTDIVDGVVVGVYSMRERASNPSQPDPEEILRTNFVVELKVGRVHKGGDGFGDIIYAHYWRTHQIPRGYKGETGQRIDARSGDFVQLFIARDEEQRLNILSPRGLEVPRES